jgi:hypothetical protein
MFEDVHADRIVGTLTTFDRMIFKGHLTRLYAPGISAMLWRLGFPLTEFTNYATAATEELTANAKAVAAEAGRPYFYSDRSRRRGGDLTKEDTARAIADRDGISEGGGVRVQRRRAVLVVPGASRSSHPPLGGDPSGTQVCASQVYLIDAEFGFMHVRVQAWIPYEIQIYVNGREWLARQLDAAGVGYRRYDNALLSVEDPEIADTLCDKLAHRPWPRLLNAFARRVNPLLTKSTAAGFGGYYWVLDQAEIATDVMFQTRPQLFAIWPDLVRHASVNLSSTDVLRFLGRKLHPALKAEVLTEAKRRPEGWRIKHRLARNWVKVYDKASVLRVETTINNPREFRVLRVQDTPQDPAAAVVRDAKGCGQHVALLPSRDRRQPSLRRRSRCSHTPRRRHRRPRGLVPTANQPWPPRRTIPAPQPSRSCPVPSGSGGRAQPRRVPQPPHRRTPLHPTTRQRRRNPPPLSTGVLPHRQAARPRPHRQGPASPALPRHPLRLPRAQRRHLHSRPQLPRRLPRSNLISGNTHARHANPGDAFDNARYGASASTRPVVVNLTRTW